MCHPLLAYGHNSHSHSVFLSNMHIHCIFIIIKGSLLKENKSELSGSEMDADLFRHVILKTTKLTGLCL